MREIDDEDDDDKHVVDTGLEFRRERRIFDIRIAYDVFIRLYTENVNL